MCENVTNLSDIMWCPYLLFRGLCCFFFRELFLQHQMQMVTSDITAWYR